MVKLGDPNFTVPSVLRRSRGLGGEVNGGRNVAISVSFLALVAVLGRCGGNSTDLTQGCDLPRQHFGGSRMFRLSTPLVAIVFAAALPTGFTVSFQAGSRDDVGRFMGGTEMRVLVGHAGKL